MPKDLKLQVLFDAIDKVTKPLKAMSKANKKTAEALKRTRKNLQELNQAQKNIAKFKDLKKGLNDTAKSLEQAQDKIKQFKIAAAKSNKPIMQSSINYLKHHHYILHSAY